MIPIVFLFQDASEALGRIDTLRPALMVHCLQDSDTLCVPQIESFAESPEKASLLSFNVSELFRVYLRMESIERTASAADRADPVGVSSADALLYVRILAVGRSTVIQRHMRICR